MLNESELKTLADKALSFSTGYETEVMVSSGDSALTRFSENIITQNVSSHGAGISIRLIKDNKMGKASTGNIADDGIKRCVETAKAALDVAESDSDLFPLPDPQEYRKIEKYNLVTHETTPEVRATGVKNAVDMFKKDDLGGAGIFSSGGSAFALANSKGLWAHNRSSNAKFSISAMYPDSSGWAEEGDSDISTINIDKIAAIAAKKAIDGRNPAEIEPGAWTVIFEPAAVAEFLLFLGWEALNGLAFAENRSCFSGKVGEKVVGENITIVDDVYHPLTNGMPFDYEGLPKQKVTLIENGVFKSTVHNRMTAKMTGLEQTGHSLPQPDSYGPLPGNLILSPGDSSIEEMIASTDKGLLVTNLHYVNILNPMTMTLTGMTRDGLFMIENGKVTKGLKNMRFTDSVLHVMSNVAAMSSKLYKTGTFWGGGGSIAPVMKVNDFHLTSKTEN
ncbi:MAG: TldD/PmbA family protein [Candidatus Hatepunaea meridiana]|nr:TldD/PmbA family protein [Candidatus Hatepunaea meridiana]